MTPPGAVAKPKRRTVDRCTICGQFIGWYPVGFHCDTHCHRCECPRCPSFSPSLAAETAPRQHEGAPERDMREERRVHDP